jgi:signal recognition particle GTPase
MRATGAAGGLTLDDYLAFLRQFRRTGGRRPALILPWVSDGLEDWATALARAERIIRAIPAGSRPGPERIDLAERQRIADDSGATPEEVGRLLDHYLMLRAEYLRIAALSFWGRVKLLAGWTRHA